MIEKRTVCTSIEVSESGTLFVRFQRQFVDGSRVEFGKPHRVPIEPGVPLDELMEVVNAQLRKNGDAEIPSSELPRVRRMIDLEHTPEVIERHAAFVEARTAHEAAMTELLSVTEDTPDGDAKAALEEAERTKAKAEEAYRGVVGAVRGGKRGA